MMIHSMIPTKINKIIKSKFFLHYFFILIISNHLTKMYKMKLENNLINENNNKILQ